MSKKVKKQQIQVFRSRDIIPAGASYINTLYLSGVVFHYFLVWVDA